MTREEAIEVLKKKVDYFENDKRFKVAVETLIPELCNNDDDRIRKDIINLIYWLKGNPSLCSQYYKDRYDGILSWLKKQEEQKPTDDKAFEEWIDDWWKHNKVNNPDSYDKGDEIQFDEKGFKNFCRGIRNMYQQKPNFDTHWENGSMVCEQKDNKFAPRVLPCSAAWFEDGKEKQKEQKTVSYSPLCNTIKDKIREYVANNFVTDTVVKTDVKSIVKAMEEGVRLGKEEQKPIDYDAELDKCKHNYLYFWDKYVTVKLKPAKWSEEDERMLSRCVKSIESSKQFADSDTFKKAKDNEIDWLENRFKFLCPQQKVEWSEEDEEIIYSLRSFLIQVEQSGKYGSIQIAQIEQYLNWLKSLRPSWKPSEEQMNTLAIVIDEYYHACTKGSDDKSKTLKTLFEQLKKL